MPEHTPAIISLLLLLLMLVSWFLAAPPVKRMLWGWSHERRHRRLWEQGNAAFGQQEFQRALAIFRDLLECPKCAALREFEGEAKESANEYGASVAISLGICHRLLGQYQESLWAYEKAVQFNPQSPPALCSLASILATSPVDALRDGPRALQLAQRGSVLSGNKDWGPLIILAAAQAECGDFRSAVATYERAITFMPAEQLALRPDSLAKLKRGEPFRADPQRDLARAFRLKPGER